MDKLSMEIYLQILDSTDDPAVLNNISQVDQRWQDATRSARDDWLAPPIDEFIGGTITLRPTMVDKLSIRFAPDITSVHQKAGELIAFCCDRLRQLCAISSKVGWTIDISQVCLESFKCSALQNLVSVNFGLEESRKVAETDKIALWLTLSSGSLSKLTISRYSRLSSSRETMRPPLSNPSLSSTIYIRDSGVQKIIPRSLVRKLIWVPNMLVPLSASEIRPHGDKIRLHGVTGIHRDMLKQLRIGNIYASIIILLISTRFSLCLLFVSPHVRNLDLSLGDGLVQDICCLDALLTEPKASSFIPIVPCILDV
ncbi:hypothetical protein C8J56DRAFT_899724 [Mycena floridula]|nr:hypothetical protein C8J56DRAFT_899724 [Mycena floridula]